jgi:tetratricopeptide (TPR) repeat protein
LQGFEGEEKGMKLRSHICAVFIVALITGLGLSLTARNKEPRPRYVQKKHIPITVIDEPTESNHYLHALWAGYQHKMGNANKALKAYQELVNLGPSAYGYGGFLEFLFDAGQYKVIISFYERNQEQLSEAFKDNIQLQLVLAQSYLNLSDDKSAGQGSESLIVSNEEKADKIFIDLATNHPDNEQVAYFATLALLKRGDLDKADAMIMRCLNNQALKSKHFLFQFLRSKIFVQRGELAHALECIEASLKLFPRFDRAMLLRAVLQEQLGNINASIEGYRTYLDSNGRDEMVEKQLVQVLFSSKRFKEALEALQKIKADTAEYYFDIALLEHKSGNNAAALTSVHKSLLKNASFAKAIILKVELLLELRRNKELLNFMEKTLTENSDNQPIVHTFLLLSKANISAHSLVKVLQRIEHKSPTNPIRIALIDIHLTQKNFKQAQAALQRLISNTPDDTLRAKSYYQLALIHHKLGNDTMLETVVAKATRQPLVFPALYNIIASHYAARNQQLDRAYDFIRLALKAAPQNPHFLDTEARILAKKGNRDKAKIVCQQALELAPADAIIQQHLKELS